MVAQFVVDFSWTWVLILSPGLLAVGVAAAMVSFTHRTLPRWLGGLAIVVALGALAPWLGIFVFVVWVLAASIVEIIQVSRVTSLPAASRKPMMRPRRWEPPMSFSRSGLSLPW